MADETPSSGSDPAEPVAGQRLAAARKARDISIFEIAKELHLDEHKVQALEENRFDMLGAPVFAKGHLRKYAQLVGVETDDVMADYYTMNRAVGAPPVVGAVRKQPLNISPGPWLVVVALVVVILAAVFLWPGRDSEDSPATEPDVETPSDVDETAAEPVPEPEPEPDDSAAALLPQPVDEQPPDAPMLAEPEPSVAEDSQSPAPVEPVAAQPIAAMAANGLSLTMRFSGDCWD